MSAPTEQEIFREARRIFRKLADEKARLVRAAKGVWTLVLRGDAQSGRIRVAAGIADALRERGWLEVASDGALILSESGRSWLIAEISGLDPHASQHQVLRLRTMRGENGAEELVIVNAAESPLAWLHARGALTDSQLEAGERLRRDYTLARMEPRLCSDWTAPVVLGRGSAGASFIPDTVLAAKQRFGNAMAAAGPGLADLLFDVCCALKGLEVAESGRNWPRRSGKVVLALALDRLAAHYGIGARAAKPRLRSWSADNLETAHG
jgi:hypothetical protein